MAKIDTFPQHEARRSKTTEERVGEIFDAGYETDQELAAIAQTVAAAFPYITGAELADIVRRGTEAGLPEAKANYEDALAVGRSTCGLW